MTTPRRMSGQTFLALGLALGLALALLSACGGEKPAGPSASVAPSMAGPAADSLDAAISGDWRIDAWKQRDVWRHPVETLAFFGVKPTDTVVELWPGGGYYTAILGPWLKQGNGKLIAATMDPASGVDAAKSLQAYKAAFLSNPGRFGDIQLTIASREAAGIAPDNSVDAVLTFRNIHNWMAGGYAQKIFTDAYRALKPGGVLGIEEHRLPSRSDQDPSAATGYVKQQLVIQMAEAAGFKFEEASEINANPRDKADRPVWMLPPTLRAPAPGSKEAETYKVEDYKAIGESDRMTLRFRKPVEAAPAAATGTPPAPTATPAPTP